MRRPSQTNFGSKQQTRISKKAMAVAVACNAREIPSVEQLMRAPYSLRADEARLVAAGIEGGSKERVRDHWDLFDVADLREHWQTCGPPAHVGIAALGAAWGVKMTSPPTNSPDHSAGPSEAEIAQLLASIPMVPR